MKRIKRVVSFLLVVGLLAMMAPVDFVVLAAEISEGETEDIAESSVEVLETDGEESVQKIDGEGMVPERTTLENAENVQEAAESEDISSEGLINYVYIEQPYLVTPAVQNIVISYGDGTENITDVLVRCEDDKGLSYDIPMTRQEDNLYLFEREYTSDEKGIYYITEFSYEQNGVRSVVNLKEIGVEALFGVDEYYPGYFDEDNVVDSSEIEMSVVDVDANNVVAAETDVEQALQETEAEIEGIASRSYMADPARSASNVVVVLDPGHGGSDSGAVGYGLYEKNLNLAIAKYCKAELEEYSGVTVKMTRDTDIRLGADASSDLANRVNMAASWGADILVSIHINSGGGEGAEVYYPNSNYNSAIGSQGHDAARLIQDELVKLGLSDRGIKVRTCVEDKYSDGSLQDYYGIIRLSKLAGFPGIIIEHAFIDNAGDAAKLKNESFLKQCGIADATGIANYFGLSKGRWETDKNGNTYYYLDNELVKGEKKISGYWYYFDEQTGAMATGWTKHHGNQYYYNEKGQMQFGELMLDGYWYYFSERNGGMVTGLTEHHGNQYYYDEQGRMQFGFQEEAGKKYYFSERNGVQVKGELRINSYWYYFDEQTGVMAVGLTKHHGNQYYYDEQGRMQFGFQEEAGKKYYFSERNGVQVKGELLINGCWYYFDEQTGEMATGLTKHHGNQYCYNEKGQMLFGVQDINDRWYYFSERNGICQAQGEKKGEQRINGYWYYFDEQTGAMATGWTKHHGNQYYYNEKGQMQFGELMLDGYWYYFSERNGVMATGWTMHHGNQYYYNEKGQMLFGEQEIDGITYYFNKGNGILESKTLIMGNSSITAEQLKRYFENQKMTYPSYYATADKEAINLLRFCQIYVEECKIEGVRPEVAFAQAMLETGYLKYGGDVKIQQFNFAGMGATGGGVSGNSFATVRLGIRAHVQHLKCYASTDALKQTCVDPRWGDWLRGKAPYVEWLSIPNNPNNTGWAADPNYAIKLNTIIRDICSTN